MIDIGCNHKAIPLRAELSRNRQKFGQVKIVELESYGAQFFLHDLRDQNSVNRLVLTDHLRERPGHDLEVQPW